VIVRKDAVYIRAGENVAENLEGIAVTPRNALGHFSGVFVARESFHSLPDPGRHIRCHVTE